MTYLKSVPSLFVFGPFSSRELPPECEPVVEACEMAAGTATSIATATGTKRPRRSILILSSPPLLAADREKTRRPAAESELFLLGCTTPGPSSTGTMPPEPRDCAAKEPEDLLI